MEQVHPKNWYYWVVRNMTDLCSGFAGRSPAVRCVMTSNLCTPIKNTFGQSVVASHAGESVLLCEV
jgi:hypothetical protein